MRHGFGSWALTATGNRVARPEQKARRMIAVVGDTQRTLWYERAFLRREQNDRERRLGLRDVAAARPELLVHLGDAVAVGASRRDWRRFDDLLAPVTADGVPVLPVV